MATFFFDLEQILHIVHDYNNL